MEITMLQWYDLSIEQSNIEKGSLELLKLLRPKWKEDDIRFMVGGLANVIIGCYEKSDTEKDDGIVIRVDGDLVMDDRDKEIQHVTMLNAAGLAARLYCRFKNGLAYEYIPGETLELSDLREPTFRRRIAKEMALLHSVNPSEVLGEDHQISQVPTMFDYIQERLAYLPEQLPDPEKDAFFRENFKGKEELIKEWLQLKEALEALNSPVVFCHNDILSRNIIYNKKKDKLNFIDFEISSFNYMAYDIAAHFCEYHGLDNMDVSRYPDKDYQFDWLKNYLEYKFEAEGKKASDVCDKDIEALYVKVNQFSLANLFMCAVWAFVQTNVISVIDYDYLGYAKFKFDEYRRRKDEFLSLELPA